MDKFQQIDYRDLPEVKEREDEAKDTEKEKTSFFNGLADGWFTADDRSKRELIILGTIILVIAGLFIYFFTRPGGEPEDFYAPPAVEDWQNQ